MFPEYRRLVEVALTIVAVSRLQASAGAGAARGPGNQSSPGKSVSWKVGVGGKSVSDLNFPEKRTLLGEHHWSDHGRKPVVRTGAAANLARQCDLAGGSG
jgi:hypothetical protein